MSIYRSFLRRPNPASPTVSATPQLSPNPNSGPSGSRYLPSIATPVPEGPLTSDQVSHIIERLQGIILNNGGRLSLNRMAARQLWHIPPGSCLPPPNAYGTRYSNSIGGGYMHNGGGAYRHYGMYPPPTAPWGRVRVGRRIWRVMTAWTD